jgi:ABC-type multidrug transport system ATPase subunit
MSDHHPQSSKGSPGGSSPGGLCITHVDKAWHNVPVLTDVSFTQPEGTIYGLAGSNGAGKSTLLKILASVLQRDGGTVTFNGLSLDDRARWRPNIGYVPQEVALDDRLTVKNTVKFWAAIRGLPKSERRRLVDLARRDPLIKDFWKKPLRECSGGMVRRVSLVVGLLNAPRLLFLDEPFAGADDRSRQLMMTRLRELRDGGCTVLIASHDRPLLDDLCDAILVIEDGKIREHPPTRGNASLPSEPAAPTASEPMATTPAPSPIAMSAEPSPWKRWLARVRRRMRSGAALVRREMRALRSLLLIAMAAFLILGAVIVPMLKLDPDKTSDENIPVLQLSLSVVDDDRSILGQLAVEFLKGISYIDEIYYDTLDEGLARLDRDEVVLVARLPESFFDDAQVAGGARPIEFWLNPRMPAESKQVSILLRQYETAVNGLYGTVFGYQRVFVDLGGDDAASWDAATRQSFNALRAFLGRDRFAEPGGMGHLAYVYHAGAAILVILALLPSMSVLVQTNRMARTSLEDRMILNTGLGALMSARVFGGALIWLVTALCPLILLRLIGLIETLGPIVVALLSIYITSAFIMSAVGRMKTSSTSVMLFGWMLMFVAIVLGGALYPAALFPPWLQNIARYSPLWVGTQATFLSLMEKGAAVVEASPWWAAVPIVPAAILAGVTHRTRSA